MGMYSKMVLWGVILLVVACAGPQKQKPKIPRRPEAKVAPVPPKDQFKVLIESARLASENGDHVRASAFARRAMKLQPNHPAGYAALGFALAQQRKLAESTGYYAKAYERGPIARRDFAVWAAAHDMLKQYAQAGAVYGYYLVDHPSDGEMRHQLGMSLLLQGNPKKGLDQLRQAAKLLPENRQISADVGYALLILGDVAGAVAMFRKSYDLGAGRPMPDQLLLDVVIKLGNVERALGFIDEFAARPHSERIKRVTGRLKLMRTSE